MPIRLRNGRLEWRFQVDSHTYSQITDYADTPRNRTKVTQLEAEARRKVVDGQGAELRRLVTPFAGAADAFTKWAEGEYREHPNSWKRLKVSMTSAKLMFKSRPLSSIGEGDLEDYKSWRRTVHEVEDVTVRHDLHALSLLFQYGKKHNWCTRNPVREIDIPSDAKSNRMRILSPAEEAAYFAALTAMYAERLARKRPLHAQGCEDLRDIATLMLNQGCRPEELREVRQSDVDLEAAKLRIVKGKSRAARRTLLLTAASRDVLAARLKTPGKWVFPSFRNPGQHIGQTQRLHADALAKSGLSFVVYDLRHTFATRAVEREMDLPRLAAILGHANLRSVMKYVHLEQGHLDEAMRKFEAGAMPEKTVRVQPGPERVQ